MKDYNEVTNDLLARRDRYIAEQKKKRTRVAGTVTLLCCVCLIALMGFGIRQGIALSPEPEQTSHPGVKDTIAETKGKDSRVLEPNNRICIQETETLPDIMRAMFNLAGADFISMSRDEIIEYYGVNIFPVVPGDLKEDAQPVFGIYKRDRGTGELYWDSNSFSYSNGDYTRTVNVGVDKGCVPFDFCDLFDDIKSKSVINNVEVGIAQAANGEYYAEFMHKGVGFRVTASGLTQDELVCIIASLL